MRPLHAEVGEEHAGIKHGENHVQNKDDGEGLEGLLHDLALVAHLVDRRAGGDRVVRADQVAERSARVLTGEDRDGVHAERRRGVDVHLSKHDVGAKARAGDERAARTDEDGCRGIEAADDGGDVRGEEVHHARGGGLHDVGDDKEAAHRDEHWQHAARGALADLFVGLEVHAQRERAEDAAHEDDKVDPEDVAECAHDGKAVFDDGGEAVADEREQHEHVDVRRHGLERAVLALMVGAFIAEFVRSLHADELDIRNGEKDGDEARAHGGDLCADEVGEEEHREARAHTREGEVGENALVALFAERHADHDERDDEHAEHVEAAGHCGVLRDGGKARVNEGRTAVDGRQARAAERGGRRVAEQRDGDGGGGVKAEGHEERGGDGGGSARARCTLKEDRQHHADDDDLHAAVVADLRNGGFHILDGAGLAQQVQNGERAEDHQHDLEAFLDALPDQRVKHLDVFSKREAVEVKIGKGKDKRPEKGNGRDGFCGFFEAQDADKHDDNWAERHEEV